MARIFGKIYFNLNSETTVSHKQMRWRYNWRDKRLEGTVWVLVTGCTNTWSMMLLMITMLILMHITMMIVLISNKTLSWVGSLVIRDHYLCSKGGLSVWVNSHLYTTLKLTKFGDLLQAPLKPLYYLLFTIIIELLSLPFCLLACICISVRVTSKADWISVGQCL
jgi:hypothetical protein